MARSTTARPPLRAAAVAVAVVVGFAALIVAGLFFPIPVVEIGSAAIAGRFPWILLVCVLATALAVIVFLRHPGLGRAIILVGGLAATAGATVLTVDQLALASDNDVQLEWRQLLFTADYDASPDEWHQYGDYEGDPLELAVWHPAAGSPTPAPVLFVTHGGGWISGSVVEGGTPVHAKWFADRGYLVIGANYTLASETRHMWDMQERQLGCALAWVGEHAEAMGGDLTRLVSGGDSAGANLAMQVAFKAHAGVLEPTCAGELPEIKALSVIYPAPDLVTIYENDHPVMATYSRTFALDYIGGRPSEFPERYEATNPAFSVTPGAPPVLAAIGEHDHLVPTAGTLAVFETIADVGVPVEILIVPFGEHAFDMHPGSVGTQVWHEVTLRWFDRWAG